MHVLIVCQYFYPERFRVNDIALGLKQRGHEVSVFTGKPNYPSGKFAEGYSFLTNKSKKWNEINITRVPLIPRGNGRFIRLALNYSSFALIGSFKALFFKKSYKPDVILVYQLSPVTMALPAIILKWRMKIPMVLYVQDLWPHSIIAVNSIKNSYVIKGLAIITRFIYKQSDRILIQSKAFKKFLIKENIAEGKIYYLPNSAEDFYLPKSKKKEYEQYFQNKIHIVFAGNIGEAQSFLTIMQAAKIVKENYPNVSWVIIGEGRKKEEYVRMANEMGIEDIFKFIGEFKAEEMPFFFAYADALLVSLKKDFIFSLTIPSKLQSYMACGRPVISSLDGEGMDIVVESGCGLTAPSESAEDLANCVVSIAEMPEENKKLLGMKASIFYKKEFDREMILDKLCSYLNFE